MSTVCSTKPEHSKCQTHHLYLPTPSGLESSEVFHYHLTTRNFFAVLLNVPLVGADPINAVLEVKKRMDIWLDGSLDNMKAIFEYISRQGYSDPPALTPRPKSKRHTKAQVRWAELEDDSKYEKPLPPTPDDYRQIVELESRRYTFPGSSFMRHDTTDSGLSTSTSPATAPPSLIGDRECDSPTASSEGIETPVDEFIQRFPLDESYAQHIRINSRGRLFLNLDASTNRIATIDKPHSAVPSILPPSPHFHGDQLASTNIRETAANHPHSLPTASSSSSVDQPHLQPQPHPRRKRSGFILNDDDPLPSTSNTNPPTVEDVDLIFDPENLYPPPHSASRFSFSSASSAGSLKTVDLSPAVEAAYLQHRQQQRSKPLDLNEIVSERFHSLLPLSSFAYGGAPQVATEATERGAGKEESGMDAIDQFLHFLEKVERRERGRGYSASSPKTPRFAEGLGWD
ncbi:MAG: hypothetical protein Q9160_007251 [Pyrenula sp. 1 TL-2023]